MATALLSTKNFIPLPQAHWIQRDRLTAKINSGLDLHHRLILISAVAGAGKSSLLANWSATDPADIVWVSLDAQDNDLKRFWTYCLAGLQTRFPSDMLPGQELLSNLQQTGILPFLNETVNLLAALKTEKLVMILDDYHLIDSLDVHNSLSYFLDHMPPNFHIIMATRSDPPLPLYRWRGRGQLTEIRFDDLRFTLDETFNYLTEAMKLNLNHVEVGLLEQRTEGWIVGLHLAALLMQGREDLSKFINQFSSNNHYILEYLTNEVLNQLSPEQQDFLLQISILPQFNPLLCEAVSGRTDSAALLDHFWRENLFLIPLDDDHFWYRYHHLFAELLHQKLKQSNPTAIKPLFQKAANWYADNGMVDNAIRAALSADNYRMAGELVLQNRRQSLYAGNFKRFFDAMEQVPQDLLDSDARLSLAYAVLLYNNGQTAAARVHLMQTEALFARALKNGEIPEDDLDFQTLPGQIASFRAMLNLRSVNLEGAIQSANEAFQVALPEDYYSLGMAGLALGRAQSELGKWEPALQNYRRNLQICEDGGNTIGVVVSLHQSTVILRIQGELKTAQHDVEDALAKAVTQQLSGLPAIGTLMISLAEIEYEKNDLEKSQRILKDSAEQVSKSGYLDIQKSAAILEAKLLVTQGKIPEAVLVLQKSLAAMQQAEMNLAIWELRAYLAYYHAISGNLQEAALWAQEYTLPIDENPGLTRGVVYFLLARVWMHLGKLTEAKDLLLQLEHFARQDDSLRREAEAQLLRALIAFRQNKQKDAFDLIEQSLENGAQRGYLRLYLDEGAPLQELIHQFKIANRPGGWLGEVLQHLIDSFSNNMTKNKSPEAATQRPTVIPAELPSLIEPLSAREIEVLGLMSEGLTNPQIARRLVISISTVKTHLNNIYGKLNVRNRAEAVLRAKDHHIL